MQRRLSLPIHRPIHVQSKVHLQSRASSLHKPRFARSMYAGLAALKMICLAANHAKADERIEDVSNLLGPKTVSASDSTNTFQSFIAPGHFAFEYDHPGQKWSIGAYEFVYGINIGIGIIHIPPPQTPSLAPPSVPRGLRIAGSGVGIPPNLAAMQPLQAAAANVPTQLAELGQLIRAWPADTGYSRLRDAFIASPGDPRVVAVKYFVTEANRPEFIYFRVTESINSTWFCGLDPNLTQFGKFGFLKHVQTIQPHPGLDIMRDTYITADGNTNIPSVFFHDWPMAAPEVYVPKHFYDALDFHCYHLNISDAPAFIRLMTGTNVIATPAQKRLALGNLMQSLRGASTLMTPVGTSSVSNYGFDGKMITTWRQGLNAAKPNSEEQAFGVISRLLEDTVLPTLRTNAVAIRN